ncbi:hypothetical protein F5Y17DRAFT_376573 [Xylariaceae sp. FL0594]|nr:hypothetical protein F5Y17DRAFT_376573 [Xylariaceae sp. FL0594]
MERKRRNHTKSRFGCLNCKKWHTKCDEQGPPCVNCRLRKAKCEYPRVNLEKSTALARSGRSPPVGAGQHPPCQPAVSLVMTETRRMLELELMLFWSTTTYKGICSVPEDHYYMKFLMPQEALRYDFLLNGIFVAAALHRALLTHGSESRSYYNVAMELYDRASKSFRNHLALMDPATHHVLYIYSSMTAFINMAFSQCNFVEGNEMNTLSTATVAFDLLNGSASLAETTMQRLLDSPVPVRAYLKYGRAVPAELSHEVQAALARLDSLNEIYHSHRYQTLTCASTPTPIPMLSDEPGHEPVHEPNMKLAHTPHSDDLSTCSTPVTPQTPWKPVLALLKDCFAEDQRGVFRGFCFVFPGGTGADFTAALKGSDPMALLVLLHWSVLVERAHDEFWWTKDLGRRLAVGILRAMRLRQPTPPSPTLLTPEWGESIAWACNELRLVHDEAALQ